MNQTEKLVAFCLGNLDGLDRMEIEEQLIASPTFVSEFIAVKRGLESETLLQVEPSPFLKGRLRQELEKVILEKQKSALLFALLPHFKLKPVFGFTTAAAVIALVSSIVWHKTENQPRETPSGISVDAANVSPVNFNFL